MLLTLSDTSKNEGPQSEGSLGFEEKAEPTAHYLPDIIDTMFTIYLLE